MAKAVTSAAVLDKTPGVRKIRIRGKVYTLRELSIGEYDACVAKATEKRVNPVTDRDEEVVNQQSLLRFMVEKSAGISLSRQADMDMPVLLTLNKIVNDMHFPDTEGKDKIWEDVTDEEDDEEGDGKGEG